MKKITKRYLEANFKKPRRDISFEKLVQSALPYFEGVDSAVSLGLYLRLKYGEFRQYLTFDINPSDYDSAYKYMHDYQCSKLFSKSLIFPSVFDTKKEAERNFIQAEVKCQSTNDRFWTRVDPDFRDPAISSVLYIAQRKIARILGDVPSYDTLTFRFGPGNVVGLSKDTDVSDKLHSCLTGTANVIEQLPLLSAKCPGWFQHRPDKVYTSLYDYAFTDMKTVGGSKLGFVPKTAKTDRAICTEPLLNSFVQLGIGDYIANRLRRAGCNIRDQKRNQELARLGSLTGDLATIDLSAASDTISSAVVLELLPLPWFNLLNDCRSPSYTYKSKTYDFHKFSSMGNGFTFPLETLIFLAVSRAVCAHLGLDTRNVNAYGDDIIVPCAAAELLTKVLSFLGFSVNESKSFSSGPFRESCGEDWFLGVSVRPLFCKNRPTNASLISWCNWIYNRGSNDPLYDILYNCFYSLVPTAFRKLKGPAGFGDGHFASKYEVGYENISSYRRRGWEGRGYYTLGSTPITRSRSDWVVVSSALYLAQFYAAPVKFRGRYDNLYLTRELPTTSTGSSREGVYQATNRDRVRTVLRLAFHP